MRNRERPAIKRGFIGGPLRGPNNLKTEEPIASILLPLGAFFAAYLYSCLFVYFCDGLLAIVAFIFEFFHAFKYSLFSDEVFLYVILPVSVVIGSLWNCVNCFSEAKNSDSTDISRKTSGFLFGVALSVVMGAGQFLLYVCDPGSYELGDKFLKEIAYQDSVLAPQRAALGRLEKMLRDQPGDTLYREGDKIPVKGEGLKIEIREEVNQAGVFNNIIFKWEGRVWQRNYYPEQPEEYDTRDEKNLSFEDGFKKDYLLAFVKRRTEELTPQRHLSAGAFMYSSLMRSLASDVGYYDPRSTLAKMLDVITRLIWLLYLGIVVSAVTSKQDKDKESKT